MSLTGGNRDDITQLMPLPLLDKIPPVAGRVGRPRLRPDALPAVAATTTTSTGACYGNGASVR
ncbi:hypothetical protein J2Z21_008260 [Streptomyces griseochromogenes]|uniref:Uncharacterized protein n=1 Tax=Streptomyces griseochromogenes TaxID=68214 RepID=A0ABS4M782_9ACTN|nr:hypothetical protein [Streptomyces griseochromogenes]